MKTIVDSGQMEEDNFRVGLTKVFFKAGTKIQ
jgi:myosin heavy subunit